MESEKKFTSFREKRLINQALRSRKSGKTGRKLFTLVLSLSAVVLALMFWILFSPVSSVVRYVFTGQKSIEETDSKTNVLLLGLAGGNHDGALLTDSIIVASFNSKTKRATLISIPRDLWLDNIHEKVNAAYEIGLMQNRGSNGLKFAEDKIDDILGIPIHYGVRIDFSGFARAINEVGGVDIVVPRTFDDYEYPIEGKENDLCDYSEQKMQIDDAKSKELNVPVGQQTVYLDTTGKIATDVASLDLKCRFEHLHFDKGLTHMDGEAALKFVRSRHGNNNEGSDFARSKRQQLVVEAFKSKVLSLGTFSNPQTVFGLLGAFGQSIDTDLPKDKFLEFYNMFKSVKSIDSIVLGDISNGNSLFITPPVSDYGAWVLIPPNNDYTQVQDLVHRAVDATSSAEIFPPSPLPSLTTIRK